VVNECHSPLGHTTSVPPRRAITRPPHLTPPVASLFSVFETEE
jgi:hypothetical protein